MKPFRSSSRIRLRISLYACGHRGNDERIPAEWRRCGCAGLTQRQLIVAGGIRSREEVDALDAMGMDAVVGMAIYSEAMAV